MSRRPDEDDDDDDENGGGSAEELAIVKEEVVELVYRVLETHLKDQPWNEASVPEWISRISSEVLKGLTDQQRPYKFTGQCVVADCGCCVQSCSCSVLLCCVFRRRSHFLLRVWRVQGFGALRYGWW